MARPWLAHYSRFVPHELPLPAESLIDIFERTARAQPASPAIHYFDETIAFAKLDNLATRFASRLERWGIGHGDRVALCTQNDPEFLVAVYGAWKRGAIIVPLSPMFKERELEYHLGDSGARVLVTRDPEAPIGKTAVEHVVAARGLIESLADEPADSAVRVPVAPGEVAYLVYTSGTTGQPKGAMCLHRAIAFNSEVYRTWMRVGPGDALLGMAPLFHITGLVSEIALSALAGVPLVLFHRFEARQALRLAARWRTTTAVAAITAYIALMNEPAGSDFSSMTKCYSGGAPVAPAVTGQFERKLGAYLHNVYGLTESNSPSHATPLDARAPVDPASGALSIGLPIPNCEARIVDITDPGR